MLCLKIINKYSCLSVFVFILDNQNIILLLVWLKMVKDKDIYTKAMHAL